MMKWRLEKCEQRFLCMSLWRCWSASHQISCICLHLPAAVSPVSGWNGAALLQQPNTEPLVLSGCLSFLFFHPLLSLVPFSICSPLSSSCIPPAASSLYKCLPPFVAVCLVCHRDIWQIARRAALSSTFPSPALLTDDVHTSDYFLQSGCQERHRHTGVSCNLILLPELLFFCTAISFFHVKIVALCDTWLMAYWICHYSPTLFCHNWEN